MIKGITRESIISNLKYGDLHRIKIGGKQFTVIANTAKKAEAESAVKKIRGMGFVARINEWSYTILPHGSPKAAADGKHTRYAVCVRLSARQKKRM